MELNNLGYGQPIQLLRAIQVSDTQTTRTLFGITEALFRTVSPFSPFRVLNTSFCNYHTCTKNYTELGLSQPKCSAQMKLKMNFLKATGISQITLPQFFSKTPACGQHTVHEITGMNTTTTQQLQNYERIKNDSNARSLLIPRFRVGQTKSYLI